MSCQPMSASLAPVRTRWNKGQPLSANSGRVANGSEGRRPSLAAGASRGGRVERAKPNNAPFLSNAAY